MFWVTKVISLLGLAASVSEGERLSWEPSTWTQSVFRRPSDHIVEAAVCCRYRSDDTTISLIVICTGRSAVFTCVIDKQAIIYKTIGFYHPQQSSVFHSAPDIKQIEAAQRNPQIFKCCFGLIVSGSCHRLYIEDCWYLESRNLLNLSGSVLPSRGQKGEVHLKFFLQ